jgi:hypothetical protein
MRTWIFSMFFLGIAALGLARAEAQPYGPPLYRAERYGERGDGVQPLDRLLPGIRRSHPGDFYDAEGPTYGPSGDPHYHLKWMTPDGRVIWYDTDARSGRVLRSAPGRDAFDSNRFGEGGPPPGYDRPYRRGYGGGYGGGGYRGYGGAPFSNGPRFAPRFSRPNGDWGGGRGRGRR